MNWSNSQVHESITDSHSQGNNQNQRKTTDQPFILQSDAHPLRMIDTKKSSNQLDLTKTGKPKYTPNAQSKPVAQSQPKPKLQRPHTTDDNPHHTHDYYHNPHPHQGLDMTDYHKLQHKPASYNNNNNNNNSSPHHHNNQNNNNNNARVLNNNEGIQNKHVHVVTDHSGQGQSLMQYYQENIKLKKKQQEMQKQLAQLKNQLNQQSQVRARHNQKQLIDLAAGKMNLWDTTKDPVPTGWKNNKNKTSMPRDPRDPNKVGHLLEIIDHYKQKLMVAQEEIQNLKRQKHLLQQDGKLKEKKNDQLLKSFHGPSNKVNSAELQEQLRNVTKLFEIEKQRNRFNQADIKRLETKIQTLEVNKQELNEMRMQNRNLQEKLLRLTSLPSFSAITDKVEEEGKFKKMQDKYNDLKQKHEKYKKDFIKNEAQLKLIRNQLIKANIEADQLSKQNFKLNEQLHDNPIISKLLQDHQLLKEVVYEIQKKKSPSQFQSQLERQNYDKILIEKQALANQLTAVRTKMAALQQNWKQRERIAKIQREQLVNTFKTQSNVKLQGKVMSKNGVAYSDDVSMFTQDTQNISSDSNYFDIFLGELHLLETMMATNFNLKNLDNILILATVDFYNHNTETTRPVHGTNCNMQSQFSFKVSEDQFFFKYLNKGTFSIEIWGSEGNKRIQLGKAVIDLRPLVLKSRKNLAPVASSSAPIYMNQKVMGSINFVMRLRLPIFQQLQKVNEIEQIVSSENAPLRKLIIQIQQGRGFSQKSNTFVYFPFRLQDYYTKTFKGTNPNWNYNKAIEVRYNNDIKNYLRKNQLQLVVMDDNAVIAHEGDTDVIGTAYVSLVPLLENRPIKDRVPVMKGTQRVGHLDIRIFWFDNQNVMDTGVNKQAAIKTTSQLVAAFLTNNKLTPDQLFDRIDQNRTGAVSYEQFLVWVPKISSQITVDMAAIYYNQFRQPLNKINFEARLNADAGKKSDDIIKQFSEINKMMLLNTEVITKKQSLREYLKDKDVYSVCLEVDTSQDGRVSKKELQKFFDIHNIEAPADTLNKQEVNIVDLIKQYQKMQ